MHVETSNRAHRWGFGTALLATVVLVGSAQRGRPPMRVHTVTQAPKSVELVPATASAGTASSVSVVVEGAHRLIRANGIPAHRVGAFPNRGNPNSIAAQRYRYRIPVSPKVGRKAEPVVLGAFGIAVNGVPFDPGAAEFYLGNRASGWQYEALSGAVPLGVDASHAHVQPSGAYHYHGLPTLLLDALGNRQGRHSKLVGWAADGFPIYAQYGYRTPDRADSGVVELKSSYRLKPGQRPGGNGQPEGAYDGTFVRDYEYVEGSGDLDVCNGRQCVTPEFPAGTYVYFLTREWPVIPRAWRGTPSQDFLRRRGGRPPWRPLPGRSPHP